MTFARFLVRGLAFVTALQLPAFPQGAPPPDAIRPGQIIPVVEVKQVKDQSYALYLPTGYTPKKTWPIIYSLDPAARGRMPVEMLREAAEKYGYIVVGSNNSRNGPGKIQYDAMQAMWGDTHQRFAIDDKRVYLTGFSGGARAATMIAKGCGTCAAGIIAHGAGFVNEMPPSKDIQYSYFSAIGTRDYNYPELVALADTLDSLKVPHRLRRYEGTHQWATPEVWVEAVEWMELHAMKENRRPRDDAFLADYARRAADRAAAFEKSGDGYAAYQEYRQLAADLDGLRDISAFTAKASELESSGVVARGRKQEERDIRKQAELVGSLYADMDKLRDDPANREEAATHLRLRMRELAGQYARKKDSPEGLLLGRALNQMAAGVISLAEAEMFRNGEALAMLCYEIVSEAHPKEAWPFYQAARLAAQIGQKKRAIHNLERAVENQLPERALRGFEKDFPAVAAEKDFQKLRGAKKAGGA